MRALAEQGACEWTQAPNATSNGGDASRVGKRCSYYLAEFAFPSVLYPDAGRVAPISACVFLQRVEALPSGNVS
ncbi:unknown [Prevotella sp. CAG:5226]|nr:unknown [Prevotella sp. CAG:5226]